MSDFHQLQPSNADAPTGPTPRPAPPPPPRPQRAPGLSCLFSLSLLFNLGAGLLLILLCAWNVLPAYLNPDAPDVTLNETYFSGKHNAKNKIAVINLDGVIMDGLMGYVHKQIDQAAEDEKVKAVVLRIDSPGGSITASDDIHRRLMELRDGNQKKNLNGKPIVVSMGAMAASGGYYVAMPGNTIVAEPTTMTGSIGVYAAFPDIAGFCEKYQVGFNTIRQGEIKDSGSPFRKMTDKERQVWQDMVDHAYTEFLAVVQEGRKNKHLTKEKLLEPVDITPVNAAPVRLKEPAKPYQRYRADGGVYTADVALKLDLIDKIGRLDDAIELAEQDAGGGDFRVIEYKRQASLRDFVLGGKTAKPASVLDPACLKNGFTPRLWYLAPGCEFAGMLSAMEEQ